MLWNSAGNMTSGPKPGAETTRIHMKYDAWNRLVKVTDAAGKADSGVSSVSAAGTETRRAHTQC